MLQPLKLPPSLRDNIPIVFILKPKIVWTEAQLERDDDIISQALFRIEQATRYGKRKDRDSYRNGASPTIPRVTSLFMQPAIVRRHAFRGDPSLYFLTQDIHL